jgi:molecular chaperone GrpE
MTKKKHATGDETEKGLSGDVTDNKDINSQEENKAEKQEENNTQQGPNGSDQAIKTEPVKETVSEISAEAKLAEMQDRYIRLSAEFDNYRKRTLREKIELTKHAGENILISIVPVMDDFERALKLMETATDCTAMKSGIDLIYAKFNDFLRQHGIKEIESLHADFNVDLHEAISKTPVEDESMKGKVVDVVQKGYYLHDKVMRFSKVIVGE